MNALSKWNPFREMEELNERLGHFFGRAPIGTRGNNEHLAVADWAPAVDIKEDEKEFLITAELPGVAKENVKVSVDNGILTLQGERRLEKDEKNEKYHRVERSYGSFTRSFTLPEGTDGTKVSADHKDGVLSVHVPKCAEAKPRTVEVKVS